MQRDKLRYVLGAATIVAMAFMLILAFGRVAPRTTESAPSDDVAALQVENAQLAQTVEQLQQREAQYQAEIEQANQTINQLVALRAMTSLPGQTSSGQEFFDESQQVPLQLFQNRQFFLGDDGGFFEADGFGHSHRFSEHGSRGF